MKLKVHIASSALLVLMLCPALGFAQSKIPVFLVIRTPDPVQQQDPVGEQMVSEIRKFLRADPDLRLVDGKQWPYIRFAVETQWYPGDQSLVSFTYTYVDRGLPMHGAFIFTSVAVCSRELASYCAKTSITHIYSARSDLRSAEPKLAETLK